MAALAVGKRMAGSLSALAHKTYSTSTLERSYILHPVSKTTDPETQCLSLTKTQLLTDSPPKRFLEYSQNLDMSLWGNAFDRAIIYAHDFDTQSNPVSKRYPFSLMQNIIKILLSQSDCHPQLKELFFVGECSVTSTWRVLEQLMSVRGEITGTLVKSKKKSSIFFDENLIKDSKRYNFPSYDTSEVFSRLNMWNCKNVPPIGSVSFQYPHTHTVVLIDNSSQLEARLIQRCLLILHGLLINEAKRKYGTEGLGLLPEPECAQGIVTDGKKFTFLWYQLNNADCNDLNDGIKNLLAVYNPGQLFSNVTRMRGGITHHVRKLVNFDENILRTLASMFLWQH